jgi:hypothetical protein
MRLMALALAAVLCSTAAMAQDKPPPPAAKQAKQAKPKAAPAKPQSIAAKLQACLEIDDATKERLNCYDAIFPPTPKPKARRERRDGLPLDQGRRRAAGLLQRLCREDPQAAGLSEAVIAGWPACC